MDERHTSAAGAHALFKMAADFKDVGCRVQLFVSAPLVTDSGRDAWSLMRERLSDIM